MTTAALRSAAKPGAKAPAVSNASVPPTPRADPVQLLEQAERREAAEKAERLAAYRAELARFAIGEAGDIPALVAAAAAAGVGPAEMKSGLVDVQRLRELSFKVEEGPALERRRKEADRQLGESIHRRDEMLAKWSAEYRGLAEQAQKARADSDAASAAHSEWIRLRKTLAWLTDEQVVSPSIRLQQEAGRGQTKLEQLRAEQRKLEDELRRKVPPAPAPKDRAEKRRAAKADHVSDEFIDAAAKGLQTIHGSSTLVGRRILLRRQELQRARLAQVTAEIEALTRRASELAEWSTR